MSTSLPASPSLEQLRRQAKDLLRAHRAGDEAARARVAAQHPRPDEPLKLSGAQLVIAREHGFPSWPRLRAYVERVAAHGPGLQHAYHEDLEYYDGRAYGLLRLGRGRHRRRGRRVRAPRRAADPRRSAHGHRARARLSVVAGAAPPRRRPARQRRAVRARLPRDRGARRRAAAGAARPLPRAGRARAARTATTCSGWPARPATSGSCAILLERGADVTRANAHGWTPLHQAAYSDLPQLARMLLDAGAPADVSARGDGGTPLVVALFWGNRDDRRAARRARRRSAQPARGGRARAARPARRAGRRRPRRPARSAASTGRTAASRPGSRPTTRVRCSTRRWRGRRATTVSRRSTCSSTAARRSRPTSTAAPP